MKSRNVSFRDSGFVEFMLMMGLVILSVMGLLSTSFQKRQFQQVGENKLSVDMLQQNYSMYIQDETAWKYTVNNPYNDSFACLLNGTPCAVQYYPIKVLHNANNEIVVNTASEMGVTSDGTVCQGFSDHNSTNCTMHIGLTWRPICQAPGGTCTSPPTVIEVNVAVSKSAAAAGSARFIASGVAGVMRKPLPIPPMKQVTVGYGHTCSLSVDGGVYCWGGGGRLGPAAPGGSLTPVKVTGLTSGVTDIYAGDWNTCAIKGGYVYCWGGNPFQECGPGPDPMLTPNMIRDNNGNPLTGVTKLSVGLVHACAIDGTGALYCWGSNETGELGYYGYDDPSQYRGGRMPGDPWIWPPGSAFPVYNLSRGKNGQAGDTDLGKVVDVTASTDHTCAILNYTSTGNNGVLCWGDNEEMGGVNNACWGGGWGLGYDPNGPKGHQICWPYYSVGTQLPKADPSNFWITSAPGTYNDFYSSSNAANTDCNGNNPPPLTAFQELGQCNSQPFPTDQPAIGKNAKQVIASGIANIVQLKDGTIYSWGSNWGGLGIDPSIVGFGTGVNIPQLATGISNFGPPGGTGFDVIGRVSWNGFCGLVNSALYCWGINDGYNRLGLPSGPGGVFWQPVQVTGIPGPVSFYRGGVADWGQHNCAISNTRVYCWGRNADGQLGDGTTTDHIMGDPVTPTTWPQ